MRRLLLSIAFVGAVPSAADAACPTPVPACDTLPNPVYLQVGDTQTNLMKRLGRAMRDNTGKPATMVFLTSGSCTNINQIYNQTPIATATVMQYVPSIAEDPAWLPASATCTCTLGAGIVPDVANSALFNSACPGGATPPATVLLTQGPVQAYVMAVPQASSQTAITFEEAYFVFGFGLAGMVAPWTDEQQLFIRTVTKSTLLAWAENIAVPGAKWKGVRRDASAMVVADLETSTAPEKAIGILGAEVYDSKRDTLSSLAFRAKGQYAAYYPDRTATSRDKQNVRDGHYTVWSPTVWMDTLMSAGGPPRSPDARYIIDLIAGKSVTPAPSFDMIKIISDVGLVPDCAMGVQRSFEGGPLSRYEPAESCVCKYNSLVDPPSTCTACTTTCATGTCRNGFCEVK
jgi:hypothetical protein